MNISEVRAIVTCSIYVATNGSDTSGNGSSISPFATLNKAQSVVSPGQTVCVKPGLYSSSKINITSIGTTTAPILFTKDPATSGAAILDGTGASISGGQSIVNINKAKFVTFDGFEIQNSPADGINVNDSNNITISNNKIHDIKEHASVMSGSNISFTQNEVYNVALKNINNAYGSGGWPGAVITWTKPDGTLSTNVSFTKNNIHDNWGEGIIALFLDGGLVQDNVIRDNFGVLLYVDRAKNIRVDRNFVVQTNDLRNKGNNRPDGILAAVEKTSNPTIIPPISNVTISNNLILGTNYGIGYWQDTENIASNNTYSKLHIYYNTIKDTKNTALWIDNIPSSYSAPTQSELKNNIIYKGANGNSLLLNNANAWTVSNNIWPDGIPEPDSTTKGSLAVNPLFVSPAPAGGPYPTNPDGYKLQQGSPAIAKGTPVLVNTDFYKNIRSATNPDIGFAQFISSNLTPTTAPACVGDINRDGVVDLVDYSILVKNFLILNPNLNPHLNSDVRVDLKDYSLLIRNFLRPC